jgi:S-adenosylmethionine:tRNA ribosyltransferase-isomerase
MQLTDFQFELPDELIAQFPAQQRSASRLLTLNGQQVNLKMRYLPTSLTY